MNPTIRFRCAAALLLCATAATPAFGVTVVARVGPESDPTCTHHDLQEAIDDLAVQPADQRIVRISRASADDAVFRLPTVIVDTDVTLIGGHASCNSIPSGEVRSILDGLSSSVIRILAPAGERIRVRLFNLSLEGGAATQGGGLFIAGRADVLLDNVLVLNNEGFSGGGIFIDGTDRATLEMIDSAVNGNRGGGRGGGIFCTGNGRLTATRGGVGGNDSGGVEGLGGGLALDGCFASLTGPFTITNNDAGRGGGIHASGGAVVLLEGTAAGAVRLEGNAVEVGGLATGSGAGLLATGAGTRVHASATHFVRNRSIDGGGGGLMVNSGAAVVLERGSASGDCEEAGSCSVLRGNEGITSPAASVNGGILALHQVVLRDNEVTSDVGSNGVVEGNLGFGEHELDIAGSIFTGNFAASALRVIGPGVARLDHVTVAGNFGFGSVLFAGRNGVGPARIEVRNSILRDVIGVPLVEIESGGVVTADCSLVHDIDRLAPGSAVFQVNPELVDVARGDLHLTEGSPAADLCLPLQGLAADLDLQPRGFDLAGEPEHRPGSFADAGADELSSRQGLFLDTFERGDLERWVVQGGAPQFPN